jgi:hypothetical protein
MTRRFRFIFAAIVLGIGLILGGGCRKTAGDKGEGTGGSASGGEGRASGGSVETAPAPILFAEIFVNDSRAASLTPDLPIIIRASFDLPEAPGDWTPGDQAGLSLSFKDSQGKQVEVEAGGLPGMPLPAGKAARGATFHWALAAPLPPGEYEVGLEVSKGWAGGKTGPTAELRVEAASLRIVEGTAGADVKSYWDRRRLLLAGRAADYLKAVDGALAGQPSDSGLRLERVEGLAMAGDKATAARELSKLLYDIQEAQRKSDPGRAPHIPSWLMDYLASLK